MEDQVKQGRDSLPTGTFYTTHSFLHKAAQSQLRSEQCQVLCITYSAIPHNAIVSTYAVYACFKRVARLFICPSSASCLPVASSSCTRYAHGLRRHVKNDLRNGLLDESRFPDLALSNSRMRLQ